MLDTDDKISIKTQLGSIDVDIGTPINDIKSELRPIYYIACNILKDIDIGGVEIIIDSDIPSGAGLGSSSACCVAVSAAAYTMSKRMREDTVYHDIENKMNMTNGTLDVALKNLDDMIYDTGRYMASDTINSIINTAISAERTIFPDTSGMDCMVSAYGGLGIYDGTFNRINTNDIKDSNIRTDMLFIAANSNVSHNTRDMVNKVGRYKMQNPTKFEEMRKNIDHIVQEVPQILDVGDYSKLGTYMNKNHQYLRDIGVSNNTLDEMAEIGSVPYGAKITGAGGGGCTCAITDYTSAKEMINRYMKKNYDLHILNIDDHGLIVFN